MRVRRKSWGAMPGVLRGVLIAVGATGAMVLLFALVLSFADLSDGAVRTVNQLLKLSAIYLGVCAAVRRGEEGGAMRGIAVGFIYMAAGVAVYALLTGFGGTVGGYLADVCMGVAAGGLTGTLRSGRRSRKTA